MNNDLFTTRQAAKILKGRKNIQVYIRNHTTFGDIVPTSKVNGGGRGNTHLFSFDDLVTIAVQFDIASMTHKIIPWEEVRRLIKNCQNHKITVGTGPCWLEVDLCLIRQQIELDLM